MIITMKLNVSEFQKNLKKLNRIIKRKPTLLILENLLITYGKKGLYLVGKNSNTIMKVSQPFEGEPFECLVNYYQLVNLLKPHKDIIELTATDKKLVIKSKNTTSTLGLVDVNQYPNVDFGLPELVSIEPYYFDDVVSFFTLFAKTDEKIFTKLVYNSVYTDSTFICVFKKGFFNCNVDILPILKSLSGNENVWFGDDDFANYFVADNVLLKSAKLVIEQYPDYKSVISPTEMEILLPRKEIIEKLKPLLTLDNICTILIDGGNITFKVETGQSIGEFSIPTDITSTLYLKVDGKQFLSVLSYLSTDVINIEVGYVADRYMLKFLTEDWDYYMVSLL